MLEQLPQQETSSEKEKMLKELEAVIDGLEYDNEYGGGEDSEGALQPGTPDFEEAKKKIREIILGNKK